jgi:hypothetical protein
VPKESIERNKRDHYKGDKPNRPPCLCENALGWDLSKCGRRGKDLGSIRLAEETRLEKKAQEEDRIQAEIQPHADRFHSLRTTVVITWISGRCSTTIRHTAFSLSLHPDQFLYSIKN